MSKILKVGDPVIWRGSWGSDAPVKATVTHLEVTEQPREKYGIEVNAGFWDAVGENRVVVSLDNGHWAYGSQISRLSADR